MVSKPMMLGAAVLLLGLAACTQAPAVPQELNGRWDVQEIAGASLGEGVRVRIDVNSNNGNVSGFTGCKSFTAPISAFGDTIAIGAVVPGDGACASPAAATDEARFLGVLSSIARYSRHGRALELLPREHGEALIRARYADVQAEGSD